MLSDEVDDARREDLGLSAAGSSEDLEGDVRRMLYSWGRVKSPQTYLG